MDFLCLITLSRVYRELGISLRVYRISFYRHRSHRRIYYTAVSLSLYQIQGFHRLLRHHIYTFSHYHQYIKRVYKILQKEKEKKKIIVLD